MYLKHSGHCPEPLDGDGLEAASSISQGVETVWATVCRLQAEDSLLADYAPVTRGLRDELAAQQTEFPVAYLTELDGAEARNLGPSPGNGWNSGFDLVHAATLAHPKWRAGKHFDEEHRSRVAEVFAQFCAWKINVVTRSVSRSRVNIAT